MKKKLISMLTAFCLVTTSIFGDMSAIAYGNTTGIQEQASSSQMNDCVLLEKIEATETGDDTDKDVEAKAAFDTQVNEEGDASTTDDNPEGTETKTEATDEEAEAQALNPEMSFVRDSETGHISSALDEQVPASEYAGTSDGQVSRAYIPAEYQLYNTVVSKYPATRRQSPYGTCWSFAATACAEFDLIKNHGYNRSIDLSELQLAYYTYHTANDRIGNLDGDQTYIPASAGKSYLDIGGNSYYATQTLAQWKGFATEATLGYDKAANTLSNGLHYSYALDSKGAKLENAYRLDIKNNPSAVKQAIIDFGAVVISYNQNDSYYCSTNNTYYCPNNANTNHDVAIVGYSDYISASAFSPYRPSCNGAWLVRNSWTTDSGFSQYGYFWMSYDDKGLANAAYVYDFSPGSKFANIYQHDGTTAYNSLSVEKVASVFTAANPDASSGARSEALEAVMIGFMGQTDVDYQIDIYSGLSSSVTTNPESGYHHTYATTTGSTNHAGIYTIYLKSKVYLAPGEKYAIVVTSQNGNKYFDTEMTWNVTYTENNQTKSWFNCVASADAGESLYKVYTSDSTWKDCTTDSHSNLGNFRIKGLTTNSTARKYTVSYNLNGGTVASGNPDWYLSTSGSTTLKTPTRDGYHFLGWYTDSNYTNQITAISGSLGCNLTLYAKWGAHSYNEQVLKKATTKEQGLLRMNCNGCNDGGDYYILVPKATLSYTKTTYSGDLKRPKVTVKTDNGTLSSGYYTVKYSNNKSVGRAKATITMHDKYYDATLTKYFSIVPKAPSSVTANLSGDYNNVKVTWKKSTGADGYYVYYKKSTAKSYSTKNRITTTKLTKTFKNLSNGVKYNFKVVPYFKSGSTKYTSIKSKTASATTLKKLSQPSISKVSNSKVSLKWKSISGASGYQVYWASSKNGKYTKLCDYSSSYSGATFTVGRGETYWYKTRAYKKVDGKKIYGPWSTPKKYKL